MTSPVAIITLSWDGHDIQDINGLHLELVDGGPDQPAFVRGRDDIIPGRAGRSIRNRVSDNRDVDLAGFVTGVGATDALLQSDYWTNRLLLTSWFVPTADPATLTATLPNGDVYTIDARPQAPFRINEKLPGYALVGITLESVDPDWTLQVGS